MLAISVSVLLLVGCSAAIGQGICRLAGWRDWVWWAPGVGFAALVASAGILIRSSGHATAVALVAVTATIGALAARSVRRALRTALADGVTVTAAALLVSLIPFLVYERTGILGEGVNNDPGSHLATVWWLDHNRQG